MTRPPGYTPVMEILRAKLQRERLQRGLTKGGFTRFLSLTGSLIWDLEKGLHVGITMYTLDSIARSLGVEPWELLKPDGDEPQAERSQVPKIHWMHDEPAFPGRDAHGNDTYGVTKLEYAAIHIYAAQMRDGLPEGETESSAASDAVVDALVLFEQLQVKEEDIDEDDSSPYPPD